MSQKAKGTLDPITFIYGVGAAIVLVGAMFKFLGWQFANELFIIGLSVEAVVFLISAFERKIDDKEYNWENVFPQLENENTSEEHTAPGYQNAMQQFSATLTNLNNQLQEMGKSVQQIKSEMETNAQSSEDMNKKLNEFNQLMGTYNENMRTINQKYSNILNDK